MVFGIFIAHGILAADIIFLPLGAVVLERLVEDEALYFHPITRGYTPLTSILFLF